MTIYKTIAAPKGQKSIHIPLTDEEILERKRSHEESLAQRPPESIESITQRKIREKWPNEYALINDIIDRGIEAVRVDKQAIIDGVKNGSVV